MKETYLHIGDNMSVDHIYDIAIPRNMKHFSSLVFLVSFSF